MLGGATCLRQSGGGKVGEEGTFPRGGGETKCGSETKFTHTLFETFFRFSNVFIHYRL